MQRKEQVLLMSWGQERARDSSAHAFLGSFIQLRISAPSECWPWLRMEVEIMVRAKSLQGKDKRGTENSTIRH